MARIRVSPLLSAICAAAAVSTASSATESTTVIYDAVGDAAVTGQGTAVAAYQDIVEVSITLVEGRFMLVMDVAGPVPSRPPLPHGAKLIEWSFRFNTDLSTCPS